MPSAINNCTLTILQNTVHFHLENVLAYTQSKWQLLESIPARWGWNVRSCWLSPLSLADQHPDLASSFEKYFAPANLCLSSSVVGILWYGWLWPQLRCFGSKQIRILPSFFVTYMRELTHSGGSLICHVTTCRTISSSSDWILSLRAIGVLHGGSTCGGTFGSTTRLCVVWNSPMQSNFCGYASVSYLMLL